MNLPQSHLGLRKAREHVWKRESVKGGGDHDPGNLAQALKPGSEANLDTIEGASEAEILTNIAFLCFFGKDHLVSDSDRSKKQNRAAVQLDHHGVELHGRRDGEPLLHRPLLLVEQRARQLQVRFHFLHGLWTINCCACSNLVSYLEIEITFWHRTGCQRSIRNYFLFFRCASISWFQVVSQWYMFFS